MADKPVKNVTASLEASIKDVMRVIDHSGLRVAYIIDEGGKLAGAVSDSEIRKAVLKGHDIKKPVRDIINTDPVVLTHDEAKSEYSSMKKIRKLIKRMPDSRFILALDNNGKPSKLLPAAAPLAKDSKVRDANNGKHVLVVGGAGYLGSVLVRQLLKRGFKVRVLDILMYGEAPLKELEKDKNFELVAGDMRNISTLVMCLDGIDSVVNLAAIVGDPACKDKPEAAIETNFLANKALAEACKYNQINRFIYASTCSVYGSMEGDKLLTEESPLNPVSLYARSKIQSEEGILAMEDENFAPVILRMSTLYGYSPRMRFDLVVNTMTKTAVAEKKIFVHGGGTQWRPLLHVADAAAAYVKCLDAPLKKIKGQIFNVGSEKLNIQIRDIAKAVKTQVPQADVIMEGDTTDPRNYFVSFSKLNKKLRFSIAQKLDTSIERMKDALTSGEIKNANDPKYYNVEYNQ
ncbi:MAG: NAD-dependent epimerase/dehydratase family protein [Candidatus Margulisiibacteriota bacterium]